MHIHINQISYGLNYKGEQLYMKNNWSDRQVSKYIKHYKKLGFNEDTAIRVYTSRLLGERSELVIHGGGNTSVKTKERDLDGIITEVLRVKGSGWNLDSIEPEGLPAVKLSPLLSMISKNKLSDTDMVNFQKRNLLDIQSPNPSVETFLHAFLPHKYVDHTHADSILAITNRPNGLKLCKSIFGANIGYVPYIMPGFDLAKKVYQIYKQDESVNTLILMNHGIFTFSDDAKESYSLMIKAVTKAENYIKKTSKKILSKKTKSSKLRAGQIGPILRGLVCDDEKSNSFIVNYRRTATLMNYLNGKNFESYSQQGTITPDHVIRIKPTPLFIDATNVTSVDDFKKLAMKSMSTYKSKYIKYFQTHAKKRKLKMLDPYPRLIYVKGVGLFCVGPDLKSCVINADLAETNADVVMKVESSSTYKTISKQHIFDIEYWSLEQAKLGKTKKSLQGKVVVITGGLGTIGKATYEVFRKEGAEVVLLDSSKPMSRLNKDIFFHCDVTDRKQVREVFSKISTIYGGIDILISNAGSVYDGQIGSTSDTHLRESFEVNFFSHQICASEATSIMLQQSVSGCLLFNISKQSVNPGYSFGPYGLPKTALLALCKQYAVDYGSMGIRSNGVNADRIKSGILDQRMIKRRAKARKISPLEYMQGNFVSREVTAADVARAFLHLALSKKTTGAILTVDGGNIAASMR